MCVVLSVLMQSVKDDIRSERNNVQSHDMVMFFAVAYFFTGYQRCILMRNKVHDPTSTPILKVLPTLN